MAGESFFYIKVIAGKIAHLNFNAVNASTGNDQIINLIIKVSISLPVLIRQKNIMKNDGSLVN